jgi:hypothetical protein
MKFITSNILAQYDSITHAFLTRIGGVSSGSFSSLNFNNNEGENHLNIDRNRAIVGKFLGFNPDSLITTNQVHRDNILIIDSPPEVFQDQFTDAKKASADAILTNQKGVVIGILTADCLPIILVDPVKRVAGIVHAGWRGTAKGICQNAIKSLSDNFESKPEDILAALGPSIGPCCYEVGIDVVDHLASMASRTNEILLEVEKDRWKLDLRKANLNQLVECKVAKKSISVSDLCTSCNTDLFFSHRKEGNRTGRQLNLVLIKD